MGRRSDHSREQLETLFLDAGRAHMAEVGFARFSAREVAKRVGYSVGTVYNLFGSYDRFVVAINARTLIRWTQALHARLEQAGSDRIAALVDGYFDFAASNTNIWMALYDHRLTAGEELPDAFNEAFAGLTGLIEKEVARELGRDAGESTKPLTGSLIAIAHGHCTFALDGTYQAFGSDPQEAALARIREALAAAGGKGSR